MFSSQIRVNGKHAKIAKKYSNTNDENAEKLILQDTDGKNVKNITVNVFETLIDCFMTSTMLGIINDRKASDDNDKLINATVFVDMLNKKRSYLERIYQHMVLTRYTNLDMDKRIKKAFGIIKEEDKKQELDNFKSYLLGGLEVLDEIFSKCVTLEDFCNELINFKLEYETNI